MKIGIITFWQTQDNYGQVLQGYALQKYLSKLGHNPFVIRYNHNGRDKYIKYRILKRITKALLVIPLIKYIKNRNATKKLNSLMEFNREKNEQRQFDEFRRKYFVFSDIVYNSKSELQKHYPEADIYIAGSDQIWGSAWTLNNKENSVFFLDFGRTNIKRIAYAPSFGMTHYPNTCKKELSRQLAKFNALSTREYAGIKICQDTGHNAEWVCDPTILLTQEDYYKLFNVITAQSKKIFIYCLNIQKKEDIFWDDITNLARKNNLKTSVTVGSGYLPAKELFENTYYDYSTIEGWLQNIHNSEFVVTTSFHGVIFCILFHKNFAFIPLKGTHSSGNNRVEEILEMLEIKNHIVKSGEDINKIYQIKTDWGKIDKLIHKFREKSRRFLLDGITKNNSKI